MSTHHETAKIYMFPQKSRPSLGASRGSKPAETTKVPRFAEVEFGSGWYHAAAVQEAERTRKP